MVAMVTSSVMTPDHPGWSEFIRRLSGPEGVHLLYDEDGYVDLERLTCESRTFTKAAAILADMPGVDGEGSLQWFREQGAYCDCNVAVYIAQVPPRDLERWKLSIKWR